MKTIRAKELSKDNMLLIENSKWKIDKIDTTRRGNIILWLGDDGTTLKFFDPLDVVVIE